MNNKNNVKAGFSLISVIIIIIITAIVSGITMGVILTNNKNYIVSSNINLSEDEDLQSFIEVYSDIVSKYYDEIDKSAMVDAAKKSMVEFLGDKYSKMLSDAEYNELMNSLANEYNGIGISISNNIIVDVFDGTPAMESGLKVGDKIVSVNNTNVEDLSSTEITMIIKGSDNDTISMVVNRDNDLMNYTLSRKNIEKPYVDSFIIENTDIGYIGISAFSENMTEQLSKGINNLTNEGAKSLILDLRNNSGGYLNSAKDSASLFIEKGKVIYSLSYNGKVDTVYDETDDKLNMNIIVLVNKNTASAAEILAASLKQSYGATLVGNKTYGKGKVQTVNKTTSGDKIKYTTAKWLTPNGMCIDGIGLNVDYEVDIKYIYNENEEIIDVIDTQLEKAIELLNQ